MFVKDELLVCGEIYINTLGSDWKTLGKLTNNVEN